MTQDWAGQGFSQRNLESAWVDEPQPCGDPECPGKGEPEQDGMLRYYACTVCGYEYGWEQLKLAGDCQLGIPEDVRRRASVPSHADPPLLQIGRRPS